MDLSNAKNEALTTRRGEKAGECDLDSNEPERVRYPSRELGGQSFRADRANWQGSDAFSQSGGIIAGGILLQLIEETHEQLAGCELQVRKLHERLHRLQKLREQLEHKAGD